MNTIVNNIIIRICLYCNLTLIRGKISLINAHESDKMDQDWDMNKQRQLYNDVTLFHGMSSGCTVVTSKSVHELGETINNNHCDIYHVKWVLLGQDMN